MSYPRETCSSRRPGEPEPQRPYPPEFYRRQWPKRIPLPGSTSYMAPEYTFRFFPLEGVDVADAAGRLAMQDVNRMVPFSGRHGRPYTETEVIADTTPFEVYSFAPVRGYVRVRCHQQQEEVLASKLTGYLSSGTIF